MASPTAPTLSTTGITAPTFADVLTWLQTQFKAIYGPDVYLGNDSQDGQFLGIIAQAITDSNAAAVACYNAFSPSTAQGEGLSSVVKINGITRKVPTASTVDVTLTGQANTTITSGLVQDTNNVTWALPASVTIPNTGSITVTATCTQLGAISAAIGTVTKIKSPVYGWQAVTNSTAAVTGQPVETDAALRVRQALSVAVPSQTIFEGIIGSVANISGVTRIKGYENSTDSTDANGIPNHSIAVVAEGGDAQTIANTIAEKKTPGTGTYGTLSYTIIDSVGSTHVVKFSRPTSATVKVVLNITQLTGFSASILPLIKQALIDYLIALPIGQAVIYSKLFVPANLTNTSYGATYNISSMTIAKNAGAAGTSDLAIAWNEAATCTTADITINVT